MAIASHLLLLDLSRVRRHRGAPRIRPLIEPGACVLVVAEDRLAGKLLALGLAELGHDRVRVVHRASSALLLAQQIQPDIIFLDVALSDGAYQLASDLRRQAGRSALRLIAMTNRIEHSTREQAREAGFERWLVTPVSRADLAGLMCNENAAS